MNRRKFTQALGALFALPAIPAKALTAAPAAAATAIPNASRFWAIYMSQLHGTVSPATLANMTGISQSAARGHLSSMIADGVIKPQNLIQRAAQAKAPARARAENTKLELREKLQKFAEKPVEAPKEIDPVELEFKEPANDDQEQVTS